MAQNANEVEQILDGTDVGSCLDMGHLTADGADPTDIVRHHLERTAIVHAKDVHKELIDKLLTRELTWSEDIRVEMFAPIDDGDMDSATITSLPNGVGLDGCRVLGQDIMPDKDLALGEGPTHNAHRSLEALKPLAG